MTAVSRRLDALVSLSVNELRAEWRRLYRAVPPNCGTDLLVRGIAYRLQEREQGGLGKNARRILQQVSAGMPAEEEKVGGFDRSLRPGTRLVRTWQGRTYAVLVTEEGFLFEGRCYRSLTAIACEITGTNWSGPRFFGLKQRKSDAKRKAAADAAR